MLATQKTAAKADTVHELIRDALGSTGLGLTQCIDRIEHILSHETQGGGYIVPRSFRAAGQRLELEAYRAPLGRLAWSVWVDVGEGDIDQAARHYHWCAKSDDLTTYQMVSLVKAIRAHESHEI